MSNVYGALARGMADDHDALTAVRALIRLVGENPDREGLRDTPKRVVKALRQMTTGYELVAEDVLGTVFNEECDEMVVVSDIPFHSLCEHHLMPFHGTATVGYLPGRKVVGLSKIPRLVHMHARRFQIQERMTRAIAEDIDRVLQPRGVGVIVKAHHTCMSARGASSPGWMTTSSLLGTFRTKERVRAEFLSHRG